MGVYLRKDLFSSSVPWVCEKTINLGQHGRTQESGISLKGRADPKTDAAEDALDIGIDFLSFIFMH